MELKTQDGYILVSLEEYNTLKRFIESFLKFKKTYIVYNRQLNSEFKLAEKIVLPRKKV